VYNAGIRGVDEWQCALGDKRDMLNSDLTKDLVDSSEYLSISLKKEVIFHLLCRNRDFDLLFAKMYEAGSTSEPFRLPWDLQEAIMVSLNAKDWT
jgi:hypothetical protein